MKVLKRSLEIVTAAGVRPFQDYPLRWRVSPDIQEALLALPWNVDRAAEGYTWDGEDRLHGFPIRVDESLPPNAMLLEWVSP